MIKTFAKIGVAAVALAGFVGTAQAGGMDASYAPAAPASPWAGVYIGLNAGAAWAEFDSSLDVQNGQNGYFNPNAIPGVNANGTFSDDTTEFTGGAQIGVNFQTGSWVMGVEGDFNYLEAEASRDGSAVYTTNGLPYSLNTEASIDWLMTVRGRLGYAMNGLMVYGTAGLAVTDIEFSQDFSEPPFTVDPVNIRDDKTTAGYAVGGGGEMAIMDGSWSIKGEYLYVSFDGVSNSGTTAGAGFAASPITDTATFANSVDLDLHVVRVGINKKIGGVE